MTRYINTELFYSVMLSLITFTYIEINTAKHSFVYTSIPLSWALCAYGHLRKHVWAKSVYLLAPSIVRIMHFWQCLWYIQLFGEWFPSVIVITKLNTRRPEWNGRHCTDEISKCLFFTFVFLKVHLTIRHYYFRELLSTRRAIIWTNNELVHSCISMA